MSNITWVKGPKPHVHSVWLYWGVFIALVGLTVVTVELANFDFGKLNLVVTLLIASFKASLVMAIFMHLAYDSKFFAVIASTSLVFLSLFILFPLMDFASRADLDPVQMNFLPRDQRVYKHHLDDPKGLPLGPGLEPEKRDHLIFIGPSEH